ncbi:MAG TPA: DUF488 domain-containing protein [Steroidobacteraceae bacterium]
MEPPHPIYTIGHSTRSILQFVELLRIGNVETVVDIRSMPRSGTNPQFNFDALPQELAPSQIGYTQIGELGGRRRKSTTIAPDVNSFWTHQSFHNYADHALSDEFHAGLTRLLELSALQRCAIMCSEALWWRCHRRIVADYLLHNGRSVFHLMSPAHPAPALLTKAAMAQGASLVYPAIQALV